MGIGWLDSPRKMGWGHNSKCLRMCPSCRDIRVARFGSGDLGIFRCCRVGDLGIFRKIRPCDPDISPTKRHPETHLGCAPSLFFMLYLNLSSKKIFGQPVGEISEKLTLTFCTSHQLVLQNFFLIPDSDRS